MGISLADFLELRKSININNITHLEINKYDVVTPKEVLFQTVDKEKIVSFLKEFSLKENDKKFVTMSMPVYNLILKSNCLDISIGIIPLIHIFRIKNEDSDIEFEQDFFKILKKYINKMEFHFDNEDISSAVVIDLECPNCHLRTFSFKITGNSYAMNFLGIIGVFDVRKKELFVTKFTKKEFEHYNTINETEISDRLQVLLNRKKLTFLKNHKAENNTSFKKCPNCGIKLNEVQEQDLEDFVLKGGKVYTITN
jgi:hypothetical protein